VVENLVEKHPRVLVRSHGGRPLVRRVWACVDGTVYITGDNEIENLASGGYGPQPIPFPPEDVFRFDPALEDRLSAENAEIDWNGLVKWESEKQSGHAP
jgi:hypothetical protein